MFAFLFLFAPKPDRNLHDRHKQGIFDNCSPLFELQTILYTGPTATVYRAFSHQHERNVIVKTHSNPEQIPSQKQKSKFSKEFNIGQLLNGNESLDEGHVVEYLDLTPYKRGLAIVMEDFNGESMERCLAEFPTGLDTNTFIRLALKITDSVALLHQCNIIHQALCTQHILWNTQTDEIKLIDLGLSSELNGVQITLSFKQIGRLLHFISPEQTGKMNCNVDFRSDLYSLGVTFYKMVTGEFPFNMSVSHEKDFDPLDVIYDAVAKAPIPPTSRSSTIPTIVSELILKLLSKSPEDRYQSTYGLRHDLKTIQDMLANNQDLSQYVVGCQDVRSSFSLSQKLYGRENEVKLILQSFEEIATAKLKTSLMLVAGYSGIGKTTLVNEVQRPLTMRRGYFISGKIDQFKRNIPFWPFIQAFKQLVMQILTEPENKVKKWKEKLTSTVGNNLQVMVDVLPELTDIVGPQQPVPEMDPSSSAIRFQTVFTNFVTVFARKAHPLIIFLDDLQWSDLPTLELLELLLSSCRHLFIIGAYRDNEVNEFSPLVTYVRKIQKKTKVREINLKPLDQDNLKQLIIDTFDIREDTEPSETDLCDDLEFEQSDTDPADLAKLVYDKTHGNPFFSVSFITNLYREGMISFNLARGQWQWFTHKIAGADISDNVVHMMTNRIKKLSHETRDVLCLAASIGSRFDFGLLSLVHGGDKQECATALWSAIKDGLIVQLGGSPFEDVWLNKHELLGGDLERNNFMQFLHDRVHQAAYELMDEEERVQTHLKIGRVMLTAFNERELDDNLFDLVTHFKHGAELITDTKERYHLAELAVQAGRRSRVSAAYSSGLDFLVFGLTMMRGFGEEEMWQEKYYHLSLELHLLLCQMYYLLGRFDDSSKLYPYIESKCQNDLDIIKVKSVQVAQFEIVQDYAGCVNTNMLSLRMLGLEMPDMDDMSRVKQVLKEGQEQIYVNLQGRKISSLVDQKRMTDPNDIAIMRCLISMWASFFCLGYSEHTGLTCVYIVNQSLLKGNCEYTAPGFACYSFSAGQFNGDYESAYEFGKVGMTLAFKDGGGRGSEMSKCYLGYPAGSHNWCQPISEGVANLKRGFDVAVESGDFAFAAYLSHHVVTDMFFDNEPLSDVFRAHQKYMSFLKKNNEFIYAFAQMATRPARALWVPRAGSWAINSIVEHHDMEPDMWRELHKGAVYETIYHYSSVIEAFYFENSQNWIQIADDCFDNVSLPLLGSCKVAEVVFVTGMIYMGHDYNDDASISEKHKEQCMDRTEQCISRFREWARLCPRNWSHKLYLLLGEKARISGDRAEALNLYEQALEVARSNQQKHGEAIAHETLGKFWLHAAKGVVHNNYARFHFDEAVSIYEEWGANGKADWMRKRYNRILTPNPHSPRIPMIIQVSNETHTVASSESGSLHRLSGSSGSTASRELHSSSSDSVAAYSSDDDVELMISPSLVSTPSSTSEQKKKITEQNNSAIDLLTFMKMDQLTEGQQSLTGFLNQMMRIVLQNTGATKGVFLQADKDNQLTVVAECDSSDLQSDVLRAVSLDSFENVSKSVVYYTARKKENVLVNDATKKKQDPLQFDATTDPYIQSHGIKSILCIPIVKLSEFKGVLYLENNLIPNAFLNQRVKVVTMLASHIALSLNEARFEQVLQSEKELKRVATELSIVKKRLEEFIDVLCHELRNPLHAIIGNKDIIADNLEAMRQRLETLDTNAHTPKFMKDKINECQESVAAMTISSDHLKDIVDTVLTVSMLEDQSSNLQVIPFTPANIIDMIAIMFKATVSDKGLTLRTEFQNEQIKTITVLGDLYRFKEVIINLVSNAIKFTDRGGSVTIKMSKESEDGEKVTLMFQVQDTGIGIKQEEIPRLFQKFGQANAQTYNKYGGSGLGLKISKEIVELMGGSQLQLESTYGEGSTFYFSVPFTVYVEGDMKPEMGPLDPLNVNALSGTKHRLYRSFTKIDFHEDLTPTRSSPSTIELKKEKKSVAPRKPSPTDIGKILVVEDNGINQKLLCRILQGAGYAHDIANNGAECVEKTRHSKYMLVLMDIEMPIMGGIEATTVIREMEKERNVSADEKLIIIGVSANSRKESVTHALDAGMQDYITKPYMKNDIVSTIEKWLPVSVN